MQGDSGRLPTGIPERLGGYRLIRYLGGGGMGTVFEAEDETLGRRAAVKVMRGDRAVPERFSREARALAKVRDPRILEIFEFGEDQGFLFIATEFLEGEDLQSILKRQAAPCDLSAEASDSPEIQALLAAPTIDFQGPASVVPAAPATGVREPTSLADEAKSAQPNAEWIRKAIGWIRDAALALQEAHRENVIHRDIKPANLFICKDGRLKILDFGLARDLRDRTITQVGEFMGTPAYMSPEQILTKRIGIDHRTDIYSLGVVLYELLALRFPFPHKSSRELYHQIVLEEPPPLRKVAPWVGRDLEAVVLMAISKNPRHRYMTARAMGEDLEAVREGRPLAHARRTGTLTRRIRRLGRGIRCRGKQVAAVALGLTIVVALIVCWLTATDALRARQYRASIHEAVLALLEGDAQGAADSYRAAIRLKRTEFPSFFPRLQEKIEQNAPYEVEAVFWETGESLASALDDGFRFLPSLADPLAERGVLSCNPQGLFIDGGGHIVQLAATSGGVWDAWTGGFLGTFEWKPAEGGAAIEVTSLKPRETALEDEVLSAIRSVSLADSNSRQARDLLPEDVRRQLPPDASVVLSTNGRRLGVGISDGSVRLLDPPESRPFLVLGREPGRARHLALSPDGRILAGRGDEGEIWAVEILPRVIDEAPLEARGLSIAEDGSFLIAARKDGRISVYELEGGEWSLVKALTAPARVTAVRALAEQKTIVWGDLEGGMFTATVPSPGAVRRIGKHPGAVWALEASSREGRIFSAGSDGKVRAWDLNTARLLWKEEGSQEPGGILILSLSPGGEALYAGGMDGRVRAFDPATGTAKSLPASVVEGGAPVSFLAVQPPDTLWVLRIDGVLEHHVPSTESKISSLRPVAASGLSIPAAGLVSFTDGGGGLHLRLARQGSLPLSVSRMGRLAAGGMLPNGGVLLAVGEQQGRIQTIVLGPEVMQALGTSERREIQVHPGFRLVPFPPGQFQMGSPATERDRFDNEGPQSTVKISKPFLLSGTEITQAQYEMVVGSNPSSTKGPDLPVTDVVWNDAVSFCQRLTEMERAAGRLGPNDVFRLPTEAEWEYACRAGSQKSLCFGEDGIDGQLPDYAWYSGNSGGTTHPVGQKKPNAWGLYDVHGNVWEWTSSLYRPYPYDADDGREDLADGGMRVLRGGSWRSVSTGCRSAKRYENIPSDRNYRIGFRVARTVE